MKNYITLFFKGLGMGVANVIPGVSGGTIALITGIYEELINSLKSLDKKALKYLLSFKIKKLISYTNFYFLCAVFSGSIVSVFTIAILFKYLFNNYPILIWSFFFGLILASIIFVGKRVKKWNLQSLITLIAGTCIAFSLNYVTPATENSNLFFCIYMRNSWDKWNDASRFIRIIYFNTNGKLQTTISNCSNRIKY